MFDSRSRLSAEPPERIINAGAKNRNNCTIGDRDSPNFGADNVSIIEGKPAAVTKKRGTSSENDGGSDTCTSCDCGVPDGYPPEDENELLFRTKEGAPALADGSSNIDYDVMAGPLRHGWIAEQMSHAEMAAKAREAANLVKQQSKRVKRATETVEYDNSPDNLTPWPRRSSDPPSPDPPPITVDLIRRIAAEDSTCHPDGEYPPALAQFVSQLEAWRQRLAEHFHFNPACFADNTRAAADRINERLSFLPQKRRQKVMRIVRAGYRIPFVSPPPPFHRHSNSPDLSQHRDAAWDALLKDMGHGAVLPCNLPRDGFPSVVSPVRTAPKGWRSSKRRFVINMRYLNGFIPEEESKCTLDTLSRVRNLLGFPGANSKVTWSITMDLASGYHNFWVDESQWPLMGFALHASELPAEAVEYLRKHFPECEDKASGNFYFLMRALPFGLGPSCAAFSLVTTSLAASWRRHPVCGLPLRLTSYIDDFLSISKILRAALIAAIELVYEATAAGLTISVEKCRLGPATRVKYLGMIIDSRRQVFRLPSSRSDRIRTQINEISRTLRSTTNIPARWIAQLVGLLWSITPCCQRAVSIMARGFIALLTEQMAASVWRHSRRRRSRFPLKRLLSAFWDSDVTWSDEADEDLRFWEQVDFSKLNAPISSDTMEIMASSVRVSTEIFKHKKIGFAASDASDTAGGGGLLQYTDGAFSFDPRGTFFSPLTPELSEESSALREGTSIMWMLMAIQHLLPKRVVVFTDSQVAATAIARGSRVHSLQAVARRLFMWCMQFGKLLMICWAPRDTAVISESDARSRWVDTYDERTPTPVFLAANEMALRTWGKGVSFDRQASHLNAMPPHELGYKLPFNAQWNQPGCSGVDMFLQPASSWQAHVNFIHPAAPTVGRLLAFLPATQSRAIVVIPLRLVDGASWWSNMVRLGGPGVVQVARRDGFLIAAIDHSPAR